MAYFKYSINQFAIETKSKYTPIYCRQYTGCTTQTQLGDWLPRVETPVEFQQYISVYILLE